MHSMHSKVDLEYRIRLKLENMANAWGHPSHASPFPL